MSIYKDQVLLVDLEATCWDGYNAPEGQENEIIEIGVCLLDIATLEIRAKRSLLVKPEFSEISPFCTQLTTITPELIAAEGMAFSDACAILEQEYQSRSRLWVSWGAFDKRMFLDQCKRRKIRYPFPDKHANLKRLYADTYKERVGMAAALTKMELTLEGTHHRGVDDAYNIARILRHLLQNNPILLKRFSIVRDA